MRCRFLPFFLLLLLSLVGCVNAELTVHYIDVGQGDAELLQSGGHNMLIDAGPASASSKLVFYLKNAGVKSLDVVVATHPHEDHIGGMMAVLNAFPVKLYIDNGEKTTTPTYKNLMKKLVSANIPYTVVKTGATIPFVNRISIQVDNPGSLTGDLNADSIVLKVTDNAEKFLFMGDAADGTGDLSAQVLKVTHHGSNSGTSKSFLNKVNPEIAIIEVGSGNDWGHPTKTTLKTLQSKGVKIYRTDLNGNIVVRSNGNSYTDLTTVGGVNTQTNK